MHVDTLLRPPDEFCRPNRVIISIEVLATQGPVGTRGGGEWMRGPGACPRWGTTILPHGIPRARVATRTSTRPPPSPTSAPGPYRTPFGRQNSFVAALSAWGAHRVAICR